MARPTPDLCLERAPLSHPHDERGPLGFMPDHSQPDGTSIDGALPIAPSIGPALDSAQMPVEIRPVDGRVAWLCGLAIVVALAAGVVAQILVRLIAVSYTHLTLPTIY